MTVSTSMVPASARRSRRALLAGAIGGVGAAAAAAIGRVSPTHAAPADPVLLGLDNIATQGTTVSNSSSGLGFAAQAVNGTGLYGASQQYVAVVGRTLATDQPAIRGEGDANHTGVVGFSGDGSNPAPVGRPKTGVFGIAAQDRTSKGVWGKSPAGHGIHGESDAGWAGWFDGKVFTNRFIEFAEVSPTPGPPGANRAKIFARDHGGHTQLCVRFHNGVIRVLATA